MFAPEHLCFYYNTTEPDIEILKIIDTNYQQYRKEGCKKLVHSILEELIQRTWEPKRAMDWCWDEEEKKFMSSILN
jgi:hypothetical protein